MNNDDFYFLLECATKAPSGHNTQPWKFEISQDGIIIRPDFTRALSVVDADNHALFISLGCALENLVIAASNKNYESEVVYPVSPIDAITVKFNKQANDKQIKDDLFDYIEIRQVNRNKFTDKIVSDIHLAELKGSFNYDGVSVLFLMVKSILKRLSR